MISATAKAGGIEGRVLNTDGEPLAFAGIYITETESGSTTNQSGYYKLDLSPGTYTLIFQYLGYQTQQLKVQIGSELLTRNIILQPQVYTLGAAEVKAGDEDPAYAMMRKVIAKSSFHRQQLDAYQCQVYIKGTGRITDIPFYLRPAMKKEGIDTSSTFVSETVTKVSYTRPATYKEEVIHIRSSGDAQNTQPVAFINGSFYNPEIAGIVSPLSPKAFAWYRFKYISSFTDRGYTILKIEVRPRRAGDDVVAGYLFLIEDLWSLHSVNLVTTIQDIRIEIRQIYAPILPEVWLPVTHQYDGSGKIFGVGFKFHYLAVVSNYQVSLNPDLARDFELAEIPADTVPEPLPKDSTKTSSALAQLRKGEEIEPAELRKIMREYEKEERQKHDRELVQATLDYKVDSSAYSGDLQLWDSIRPVALSKGEIRGYHLQDSLANVELKNRTGDTLGTTGSLRNFSPLQLLLGAEYELGNNNFLKIHNPLPSINFNTVDGYNFNYQLSYYHRFSKGKRLEFSPMARYTFSREKIFGTAFLRYDYGTPLKKGFAKLEAGYMYRQYNLAGPVTEFTNSFASLFFENNIMKMLDRQYALASWSIPFSPNWQFTPKVIYARRIETFNTTDQVITPWKTRHYSSNIPEHKVLTADEIAGWGQSDIFRIEAALRWQVGQKYNRRNERYYPSGTAPVVTLSYKKAIPDVGRSEIRYDFVALNTTYRFDLSRVGSLGFDAEAGVFLHTGFMEFIDYQHFLGNELPFTRWGILNGFSLLPYYKYSTDQYYTRVFSNLEFSKLLLTQIKNWRLSGLTEHINVNYLYNPLAQNYVELVYSLTDIFRFGRIDFVASFEDGKYRNFGIQFGISSSLFGLGTSNRE